MDSNYLEMVYSSLISAESLPDICLLLEHPETYVEAEMTQVNAIARRYPQAETGTPSSFSGQWPLFPVRWLRLSTLCTCLTPRV